MKATRPYVEIDGDRIDVSLRCVSAERAFEVAEHEWTNQPEAHRIMVARVARRKTRKGGGRRVTLTLSYTFFRESADSRPFTKAEAEAFFEPSAKWAADQAARPLLLEETG